MDELEINQILYEFTEYLESGDAVVLIDEFTDDERKMLISNFRRWSQFLDEEDYK